MRKIVPLDKLQALAAIAPKPSAASSAPWAKTPANSAPSANGDSEFTSRLDIPKWLTARGVAFRIKDRPDGRGRTVYVLEKCPFDEGHGDPDSCIMQADSGALSAQCFHDSCKGRGWQDFKDAIGAPAGKHYDPPLGRAAKRTKRRTPPRLKLVDVDILSSDSPEESPPNNNGTGSPPTDPTDPPDDGQEPPDDDQEPPVGAAVSFALPMTGEEWNDPNRLARLYEKRVVFSEGLHTELQWRDEYHRWNGTVWQPVPTSDFTAKLARHIRCVFEHDYPIRYRNWLEAGEEGDPPTIFPVTDNCKRNMLLNLGGILNRPDDGTSPPFWLEPRPNEPNADAVIVAPNGLFRLEDIAEGRPPFSPPTPRLFTPTALPFDVPETAPPPEVWLQCLNQWFSGDPASIAGLQEWCGYLIAGSLVTHKVLMLIGPPRSGKGTILRILRRLIGKHNVASTNFAAFGETFGLENLVGKSVAYIPDARMAGRADVAAIVEKILSISGEDDQKINQKHKPQFSDKLRVRFVLASNEMPRLPDASGAVATRFYILNTPNSWLGKEDPKLEDKLTLELPGILIWAAKGWCRLVANGMRFTPNSAAEEFYRQLEDLSSPVKVFLRECCQLEQDAEVARPALYAAWHEWNRLRNRQIPSENIFGRDLQAVLPGLKSANRRCHNGRTRFYLGIALKPESEWGEDETDVTGTGGTGSQPPNAHTRDHDLSDSPGKATFTTEHAPPVPPASGEVEL